MHNCFNVRGCEMLINLIDRLTEYANRLLWGPWSVLLVLFSGVWFGATNGWLQFRPKIWAGAVASSLKRKNNDDRAISPLQSAATSLAGMLGTGNIVGVATAMTLGGAGAVFWMWTASFFGMMVSYAETVLGMVYRRRDSGGQWLGGPMMYMEHGRGGRTIACAWAVICAVSAFGVGNLTQVNSIAHSAGSAWGVPMWATGLIAAVCSAPVILGGVQKVAKLCEKLIPAATAIYIAACIAVLAVNYRQLPSAFGQIFAGIFTPSAAGGGALGAMMVGIRRGIFTNEAGLGSSVLVHSSADCDSPSMQGMWGIFEVFADTVVMCTMTALVILTSGALGATDANGQMLDGAVLSAEAFSCIFGEFSGSFITVTLILFAFATIIGWSCCGERAFGYLFGGKYAFAYRLAYVIAIVVGGMVKVRTVWALSDVLNGLMLIPNTVVILLLWREVSEQTQKYAQDNNLRLKIHSTKTKPTLSEDNFP